MNLDISSYTQNVLEGNTPILGWLSWHSVGAAAMPQVDFYNDLAEQYDAPIEKAGPPKPVNIFRRAANDAKMLKQPLGDSTYVNYTFRNSGHDEHAVYRNLIEEIVDGDENSLSFREIERAAFGRESHRIAWTPLGHPSDTEAATIVRNRLTRYYDAHVGLLTPILVREAARRALENTLEGVSVRPSGGIYFLPVEKHEELQALQQMYAELPNSSIFIMPVVDDATQREMVREAFEVENRDEAEGLLAEVLDIQESKKKLTASQFAALQERYAGLSGRLDTYRGFLKEGLDDSQSLLSIADQAILSLVDTQTKDDANE